MVEDSGEEWGRGEGVVHALAGRSSSLQAVGVGCLAGEQAGFMAHAGGQRGVHVGEDDRLGGELGRFGNIKLPVQNRIAGGVFVDVGGAVADPQAGDEDGELDVELDLAHLEGGGVPVAHEVADQAFVVLDVLGARPI